MSTKNPWQKCLYAFQQLDSQLLIPASQHVYFSRNIFRKNIHTFFRKLWFGFPLAIMVRWKNVEFPVQRHGGARFIDSCLRKIGSEANILGSRKKKRKETYFFHLETRMSIHIKNIRQRWFQCTLCQEIYLEKKRLN